MGLTTEKEYSAADPAVRYTPFTGWKRIEIFSVLQNGAASLPVRSGGHPEIRRRWMGLEPGVGIQSFGPIIARFMQQEIQVKKAWTGRGFFSTNVWVIFFASYFYPGAGAAKGPILCCIFVATVIFQNIQRAPTHLFVRIRVFHSCIRGQRKFIRAFVVDAFSSCIRG